MSLLTEYFLLFKTIHIIAVIAWMAGLFYLPRLYAYHADAEPGSPAAETFKIMERRLLRAIMNPAMIVALLFGALTVPGIGGLAAGWWMWAKLAGVGGLVALHMMLARWRKTFAADANTRPARFYKFVNEIPTLLVIVIVAMVVFKPL